MSKTNSLTTLIDTGSVVNLIHPDTLTKLDIHSSHPIRSIVLKPASGSDMIPLG
jgi:hypothetical protein